MPGVLISYDNNSKGIFYSGQSLSGTISFDNEKSRKFHSISLTFEGYAKCKWRKRKSKNNTVTYRGRQDFVNQVTFLISSDIEGKQLELEKGLHKYPFRFRIPDSFPTSIEACKDDLGWGSTYGLRGCVRYLLTLKATRSWKSDIKQEFPITIIKNYNLNFADPRYQSPVTVKETKNFTFSSKALHMSVDAQLTGFVCGQKARFLVSYNNESSTDVAQTKVQLVRINQYNADNPKRVTKTGNEGIALSTFEGVPGKTTKNVEVHLVIPSVAPSSDGSCSVMVISYEIQVTAVFGGLHSDHTLTIPIVIGTVPYLSAEILTQLPIYEEAFNYPSASAPLATLDVKNDQRPQDQTLIDRHSIGFGWNFGASTSTAYVERPSAPVPTTPEAYDMPPPSYIEAINGHALENSEGHATNPETSERQTINFTPSYPVYNFDQEEDLPPKYNHKYR